MSTIEVVIPAFDDEFRNLFQKKKKSIKSISWRINRSMQLCVTSDGDLQWVLVSYLLQTVSRSLMYCSVIYITSACLTFMFMTFWFQILSKMSYFSERSKISYFIIFFPCILRQFIWHYPVMICNLSHYWIISVFLGFEIISFFVITLVYYSC